MTHGTITINAGAAEQRRKILQIKGQRGISNHKIPRNVRHETAKDKQ